MTRKAAFSRSTWLLGLAGMLLFIAVIAYQGVAATGAAVAAAGWGLLWVSLFHVVPLLVDTCAWQIVLAKRHRIGFAKLTGIAWIGEAVNTLLPVALIGGGLVRTRLLKLAGVPGAPGGASVVVDLTIAVISLLLFSLAGVALLFTDPMPGSASTQLLSSLGIFSLLVYGFYRLQRRGLFLSLARRLERMNSPGAGPKLSNDAAELDRQVADTYQRHRDFWLAFVVRLLGWVVGAGEVWLALHYLGHPVSLFDAVMLESLVQAIRSAAFLVPGALGVQEGALLLLGASIGIPPPISVAMSLVKRVRELSLGLPALLLWHGSEVRHFRRQCGRKPFMIGQSE